MVWHTSDDYWDCRGSTLFLWAPHWPKSSQAKKPYPIKATDTGIYVLTNKKSISNHRKDNGKSNAIYEQLLTDPMFQFLHNVSFDVDQTSSNYDIQFPVITMNIHLTRQVFTYHTQHPTSPPWRPTATGWLPRLPHLLPLHGLRQPRLALPLHLCWVGSWQSFHGNDNVTHSDCYVRKRQAKCAKVRSKTRACNNRTIIVQFICLSTWNHQSLMLIMARVSYMTRLDLWMVTCIFLVFLCIFEFVLASCLSKAGMKVTTWPAIPGSLIYFFCLKS